MIKSENALKAVNQQGSSLLAVGEYNPSETTRRSPTLREFEAYLLGAAHDGTCNSFHATFRFSQKSKQWLVLLKKLLDALGYKAWIYKEGKNRTVYVMETTAKFLRTKKTVRFTSKLEIIAYARGYFDSEGGVPHNQRASFYIQLCQKDRKDLSDLRDMLTSLGIVCGILHNPSKRVDPDYWRFYILRKSHQSFIFKIGSWHPMKAKILKKRTVI